MRKVKAVVIISLFLLQISCKKKSQAEKVEEMRSKYAVKLNSWIVKEDVAQETFEQEDTTTEEIDGEETKAAEGEENQETQEAVPKKVTVLLDFLVRHSNSEPLPGITVEVYQMDKNKQKKREFKIYLPTEDLLPNISKQITYELKDIELEDGDGFAVEIISPVPPEQRGEYKEFNQHTG